MMLPAVLRTGVTRVEGRVGDWEEQIPSGNDSHFAIETCHRNSWFMLIYPLIMVIFYSYVSLPGRVLRFLSPEIALESSSWCTIGSQLTAASLGVAKTKRPPGERSKIIPRRWWKTQELGMNWDCHSFYDAYFVLGGAVSLHIPTAAGLEFHRAASRTAVPAHAATAHCCRKHWPPHPLALWMSWTWASIILYIFIPSELTELMISCVRRCPLVSFKLVYWSVAEGSNAW